MPRKIAKADSPAEANDVTETLLTQHTEGLIDETETRLDLLTDENGPSDPVGMPPAPSTIDELQEEQTEAPANDAPVPAIERREGSPAMEKREGRMLPDEQRKHHIARAMRQRQIGRQLIQDSARRTGYELEFRARLRESWSLFERFFMTLDDGFSYALERGTLIMSADDLGKLEQSWHERIDAMLKALQEESARLNKLVEDMALENPHYRRVAAGVFNTVRVRIESPLSLKLLDVFNAIDPLLISADTLWWNGRLGLQEKGKVLGTVRQEILSLSQAMTRVRFAVNRYVGKIAAEMT